MVPHRRQQPNALRQIALLAGAGVQFAATVALCTAIGWWLDGLLGWSPWLLIVGGLTGAVAAFYLLYRSLMSIGATDHLDEDN